jgi:hypothetical protein
VRAEAPWRHDVKPLADTLWMLVRWALPVTVAGVLAAGAIGSSRLGEEVRSRVQQRLAQEFPTLVVHVQGASLVEGEGIVVRGVSVSDPALPREWQQLVWIDEVRLACSTNLADLVAGTPKIGSVRLRRPVVHAVRQQDGAWTTAALVRRRGAGTTLVPVVIDDASVLVDDVQRQARAVVRQIALEVQPDEAAGAEGWASIRGTAAGELFERASIEGRVAIGAGAFELRGAVQSLDFTPRIVDMLPSAGPQSSADAVAASGACRSVPTPGGAGENGSTTTSNRSSSGFQNSGCASGVIASRRDARPPAASGAGTSRVSMLREPSVSTTIVGFSRGRYSSTHSGWLRSTATNAATSSRSSSTRP